jgi:carboxylesterase
LKDERLRSLAERAPDSLIDGAIDRLPLGALYQMYRMGRRLERMGKSIQTPTLILHARDDDMSHPRNAYRLQRALGGPTRLLLLEDSFHMIHVDQERDRVAAATAAFFGNATLQGSERLERWSHA